MHRQCTEKQRLRDSEACLARGGRANSPSAAWWGAHTVERLPCGVPIHVMVLRLRPAIPSKLMGIKPLGMGWIPQHAHVPAEVRVQGHLCRMTLGST